VIKCMPLPPCFYLLLESYIFKVTDIGVEYLVSFHKLIPLLAKEGWAEYRAGFPVCAFEGTKTGFNRHFLFKKSVRMRALAIICV
jgi:hypothetical protein